MMVIRPIVFQKLLAMTLFAHLYLRLVLLYFLGIQMEGDDGTAILFECSLESSRKVRN